MNKARMANKALMANQARIGDQTKPQWEEKYYNSNEINLLTLSNELNKF